MAYKNKSHGCNMTRQHFEKIAEIIRDLPFDPAKPAPCRETIAELFANALQSTNNNFKYNSFISACLGE